MGLKCLLLGAALALAALSAQAQSTYRCAGKDGKKYYGSTIPQQCAGLPAEELSPSGTVLRRIDPAEEARQRAAKEAEAAKKRDEEVLSKEESRRNQALLATYTSEKDIDEARGRALAENEKAIKETEQRINNIKKHQASLIKEMEFYQEGAAKPATDKKGSAAAPATQAKSGGAPPQKLLEDIKNAETDLKAQENLLAVKKKDVDTINAKYDEDKRRFTALTKRR